MPIFVFFVTAGVLFDGAFSLWVSSKESGKKPGATVSNKYQIQLKKVFPAAKIQKQPP